MKSIVLPPRGFANRRNRTLRPRIVQALRSHGRLNALELATLAYGPPRCGLRRGRQSSCTTAQLVATRRALRTLAARGRIVAIGRYRRWKLFTLQHRADGLSLIPSRGLA